MSDTNNAADIKRQELTEKLQNHFFIVGGGAWQTLWEPASKTMGFNSSETSEEGQEFDSPDYSKLKSSISPELLRRFSPDVLVMHPLTRADYQMLTGEFAKTLKKKHREVFIRLAKQHLNRALKDQIGMRFFESMLTKTLVVMKKEKKAASATQTT